MMQIVINQIFKIKNHLLGLLILLIISAICLAFSTIDTDDFDSSRRQVLLRRIGHEVLLQAGDSTSRVLPLQKITENEYQIRFENELTFQTDSLVSITQRLLPKDPLVSDYIVSVLLCNTATVVYGYAISKNKTDEIVTCIGRRQPKACYIIAIKFKPNSQITAGTKYFFGGVSLLAFVGFVFLRSVKPKIDLPTNVHNEVYTFGGVVFDVQKRQLLINQEAIDLTGTEARLLLIFALAPNEIIARGRLQKELWEDEGIIVGRSLDMFISKLRKKLVLDPNSNIVVIRNIGYKLEVNS